MAKRNLKNQREVDPLDAVVLPKIALNRSAKKSIFVVFIFVLGLISLLGLFDLSGQAGSWLSKNLETLFGWGKWAWPLLLLTWGWFLYKGKNHQINSFHYWGLFLLFISYQSLFHFFISAENSEAAVVAGYGGGYVGFYLSSFFNNVLGFWGGLIILFGLLITSLILILNTSLHNLIGSKSFVGGFFIDIKDSFLALFRKESSDNNDEVKNEVASEDYEEEEPEEEEDEPAGEKHPIWGEKKAIAFGDNLKQPTLANSIFREQPIKNFATFNNAGATSVPTIKTDWKTKKVRIDLPLDLLQIKTGQATSGDIERGALIIRHTLENFGIPVEMGEVSVGPTVTQYTFKPAEGIKLSRITALGNDLSLALAAYPLRVEAPIPGKALVGLEVPNKTKAMVGLREILEDKAFKTRTSNLMMALGKDVAGANWLYDITKMPHLLVAGSTNSGKSVCLNTMIVSLLYQNSAENLRFIMVDPKRVELVAYNGIPHLLTPVITEVSKTINALKWCLNEMDRRYDILNKSGKKNIQSYNLTSREKMPFIIFVIDELADLMVTAAKDIEGSIIRLTQMSRAVGIHLILATQRPSVDVITGLIKANTPSRIAFSVASAIDSKTILDCSGAEKLLGKGDMLFSAAEMSKPKRIQGAFVSDEEINAIIKYIKDKSGEVEYLSEVTERQKVGGMAGVGLDGNMGDEDELLQEAKEAIISMGRASTSLLQRKLRIGYGRAAAILDHLEEAGIIGPSNGSKPREVLISRDQYEDSLNQGISAMPVHNRAAMQAPQSFLSDDEDDVEEGDDGTLEFDPEEEVPFSSPEEYEEEEEAEEEEEVEEEDEKTVEEEVKEEIKEEIKAEPEEEVKEKKADVPAKDIYNRALYNNDDDDDDGMYFSK